MANQIKLPNLGENIESGDVLSILVSEGDTVKANQDLLEVETDKATMPVPSPQAGKITKILVARRRHGRRSARRSWRSKPPAPKRKRRSRSRTHRRKAAPPKPKQPEPEEAEEADADEDGREEERAGARSRRRRSRRARARAEERAAPTKPGRRARRSQEGAPSRRTMTTCRATATRPPRPAPPCAGSRGSWASICAACGRRATAAASRPKTCSAFVRETNEQVAASTPARRHAARSPDTDDFGGVRIEKMSRMRQTIARNMVAVVHDDPAAHELRRRRRHRARGHARAEQGRLRRPRHQAHRDAVRDQGGRLVAQAAPDAQCLGRHGEQHDHLQGVREHRHRGRHRARPGGAGAARRRSQEHLADRGRAGTSWPSTVRDGKFDLDD